MLVATADPRRLLALLLVLGALLGARGMRQSWSFDAEDRAHFLVERFGVGPTGQMDVRVVDVHVKYLSLAASDNKTPPPPLRAGLLFVHEDALWEAVALMDDAVGSTTPQLTVDEALAAGSSGDNDSCVLVRRAGDQWIDLADASTWNVSRAASSTSASEPLPTGFYYLFFAQCSPGVQISFHMDAVFRNGASDYLSAGDAPLPLVYLLTSLLFFGAAVAWIRSLVAQREHVHRVHWLMALLVSVKTLALFAEAMRAYYMKRHGDTLTAWTAVTYTFLSLKGLLLFSVLLLIGMGWSLLKPHLSPRDKSVLSLVLLLQIVSNTARIVESETAVGTRAWVSWRDLLLLADVACCAAVLLPIVWSIRELRLAAATDGKAFVNLQKLTQFRSFYLLVVSYLYVTRLALQLLQASLPYNATWVAVAVGELSALGFFVATGYRFRPLPLNPYLEVPMHVDDLEEFALDDEDDDLDLRGVTIQRHDHRELGYPLTVRGARSTSPSHETTKKRSGSMSDDV